MCGIAGICRTNSQIGKSELKVMTDKLIHRGPDGEGFFINPVKNVGFGHRRLSIIDLSHDADQPMSFNELTLVYNGEIFNYIEIREKLIELGYSFHTKSDTEVLLKAYHHYRENIFDLLDGMFAFAIWDENKKELFCARDRFGERPFYYYYDNDSFVFASEMKALWAYGVERKVNLKMVYYYYTYDVIENPYKKSETFFENIYKLEAAHYIKVGQDKKIIKRKYWEIDRSRINYEINEEEAVNMFSDLFQRSIKRRLRSDVALGTSLSGGLDSSSVVAANNKFIDSQFTFTARFDNPEYDEGQFVDLLKEHYSLKSYNTFPTAELLVEEFDKLYYHQEEPFQSASIFAQWEVMKLAKTNGVTVLLDGQGADEILAGYHKYFLYYLKELYATDKEMFQDELNSIKNLHKKNININLDFKISSLFPGFRGNVSQFIKKTGIKKHSSGLNSDIINQHRRKPSPFYTGNELNDVLYFDTFSYGLEKLLRFADRNAMAHSREIRLPFLSHELVEFIFSLPSNLKIRSGWTKYILRKSYENELTDKIAWRVDKKGYQMPMENLFENEKMKEYVNHAYRKLLDEKIINNNPVNTFDAWKMINLAKLWER